jgi:hypothetical protein
MKNASLHGSPHDGVETQLDMRDPPLDEAAQVLDECRKKRASKALSIMTHFNVTLESDQHTSLLSDQI